MAIQALDGRLRGKMLLDGQGKLASFPQWEMDIQKRINEYYSQMNRYSKYLDQNPDLKVYVNDYKSKIADLEKEKRLVNFSNEGISQKLDIYGEALKKKGVTGKAYGEQIAQYRDVLMQERRNYFDMLKGKNNARIISLNKPIEKPGFFSRIGNFFKGMFSKVKVPKAMKSNNAKTAIAATLLAGGTYGLYKLLGGCSDKKNSPVENSAHTVVGTQTSQSKPTSASVDVAEYTQTQEPAYKQISSAGLSWEGIVRTYYPELIEKHNGVLYGKDGAIRELKEELAKCGDGVDLIKSTDIPRMLNLPLEIDGVAINEDTVAVRQKFNKAQTGGHTDIQEAGCKNTRSMFTVTDKQNNAQYKNTNFDTAVDSLKQKTGVKEYKLTRVS